MKKVECVLHAIVQYRSRTYISRWSDYDYDDDTPEGQYNGDIHIYFKTIDIKQRKQKNIRNYYILSLRCTITETKIVHNCRKMKCN